jgi:histone deacetylase 6
MTSMLKTLAGGKLLLVLEGGYNVKVVGDCSEACTRALLGQPAPKFPSKLVPSPAAISVIESVVRIHSVFWNCLTPIQIDIPRPVPDVGSLDLQSVLDSHWSHLCKIKFDLLPLSILEDKFVRQFQGRVHISDGLLNEPKSIVIFAHETGSIIQGMAPNNDSNFLDSTVDNSVATYQISFLPLIEEIQRIRSDCKIIDIHVPARNWKIKQSSAAPSEELALYNEFFQYLWDNYIQLSGATNIFFISTGLSSYAISKIVESRPVEERVKGITIFSSTLFLPIAPQEKAQWYKKVTRVFVPGTEKPIGTALTTADVFGSCFSIGPSDPSQKLLAPAKLKANIVEFVSKRIE